MLCGLHVLAWNSPFPTHLELILWRVSSLGIASPAAACAVLMLLMCIAKGGTTLVGFIFRRHFRKLATKTEANPYHSSERQTPAIKQMPSRSSIAFGKIAAFICIGIRGILALCLVVLYLPAHGYLLWESVRTVFFLPPEAYTATSWTRYLPHIT